MSYRESNFLKILIVNSLKNNLFFLKTFFVNKAFNQ